MQVLSRILLSILIAIAIAMPGIGGEGGENAGGTGVWILPRSSCLSSVVAPISSGAPTRLLSDFAHDFVLRAGDDCGLVVATATNPATATSFPLVVSGRDVILTTHLFDMLRASGVSNLTIVIADAQNMGYVITVSGLTTGSATFTVR